MARVYLKRILKTLFGMCERRLSHRRLFYYTDTCHMMDVEIIRQRQRQRQRQHQKHRLLMVMMLIQDVEQQQYEMGKMREIF